MNFKKFRYMNRIVSFALAVCLTLSLVSVAIYAKNTEETEKSTEVLTTGEDAKAAVGVVFAKSNIRQGAKFTEKNVEFVEVPAERIPQGAVTAVADIVGKYAAAAISAGEYIYSGAVSKSRTQGDKIDTTYVNIANYVKPNLGEDVAADIQQVIEKNPKRTIYFPDGEYLISKSLITYGDPDKTVCFLLADGAVIKATDDWTVENECDCLISSGAYNGYNEALNPSTPLSNVVSVGSYFWIQGGALDGNGVAGGISLDGGRESLVKNVTIRNVPIGIRVNRGVNNTSSDMDIDDVTIYCTGAKDSIGIEVLGYDNTFTNIRIYSAHRGIVIPSYVHKGEDHSSGGNAFRDIRIVRGDAPYSESYGVYEHWHANFYYHCYVEDYETGMRVRGQSNILDSLTIRWTKNEGKRIAFTTPDNFHSCLSATRITSGATINSTSSSKGNGRSDILIRN